MHIIHTPSSKKEQVLFTKAVKLNRLFLSLLISLQAQLQTRCLKYKIKEIMGKTSMNKIFIMAIIKNDYKGKKRFQQVVLQ